MAGVDIIGHDAQLRNPGKPQVARGRVVVAPSSVSDGMKVQLIGWSSSDAYEVPARQWMPRTDILSGGADADWVVELPQVGSHCLVCFDHLGDCWVSVWS